MIYENFRKAQRKVRKKQNMAGLMSVPKIKAELKHHFKELKIRISIYPKKFTRKVIEIVSIINFC